MELSKEQQVNEVEAQLKQALLENFLMEQKIAACDAGIKAMDQSREGKATASVLQSERFNYATRQLYLQAFISQYRKTLVELTKE